MKRAGKDKREEVNFLKISTRTTRIVYWVCQVLIFGTLIASIVQLAVSDDALVRSTQASHIMLCVVAHFICLLPIFLQKIKIVSTVSAFVVCVIGYFSLKYNKTFLNRFLLRKIYDYDTAIAEAEEAGDIKLAERLKKAKADALKRMEDGEDVSEEQSNEEGTAERELDNRA